MARRPDRHEFMPYEGHPGPPAEVWFVADDDLWLVWCMECGVRIGTVNAGNEHGAVTLTTNHNRTLHQEGLS